MKNNQIRQTYQTQLNESFIGTIKKGLVKTRQQLGLKKYGSILPEKLDHSSIPDPNESKKSGFGPLFSYEELLKDSRPKRMLAESNEQIELTEAFIQNILNKVKNIGQLGQQKEPLVIKNYPAKQQKLDKINMAKNQIKRQLMGLDMELERINSGKHKGYNPSEVGKFNSSKLLPKSKSKENFQKEINPKVNIYA